MRHRRRRPSDQVHNERRRKGQEISRLKNNANAERRRTKITLANFSGDEDRRAHIARCALAQTRRSMDEFLRRPRPRGHIEAMRRAYIELQRSSQEIFESSEILKGTDPL
jgi:hypothetical protein